MNVDPATLFFSFIVGTAFGSFFHTLALRISGGMFREGTLRALVSPSACPSCGMRLSPVDLIPVLGYLIRRGRCRGCGTAVSPLYPLMELLYGITALLCALILGWNGESLSAYLVMAVGITVATVDVKTMKLPLPLVAILPLLAAGPSISHQGVVDLLGGFLLLFLFFGIVLLLFPGSFGGGDLWYGGAMGLLFTLEMAVVLLEVSLVSGALFGVLYALITKKGFRSKIPFAPFITLGAAITYFFGRRILFIYYGIFF